MLFGILCDALSHLSETGIRFLMIQSMKQCQKLVTAIPAHKMLLWNCQTQLLCKRTDVFVSFIMSQIVVDRPQIVQIKDTDRHWRILRHWLWCI